MPYVRRKGKARRYRRKARTGTRKARKGAPWITQTPPRRQTSLWPDAFKCKLRYAALYEAGVGTTYISFRGNGPYDPETAAGGNQPIGFDQLSAIYYNHYVRGSSFTVRFVQGSTPVPCAVTIYPTLDASTSAQDKAQPDSKTRIVGADKSSKCVIRSYMTTNKQYGRDTTKDQKYSGGYAAVPDNQWYWHARIASLDGSTLDGYLIGFITYYITFSGRRKLEDA